MTASLHEGPAVLPRKRLLLRGESAIAWLGAGMGLILVCAMSASAVWAAYMTRQQAREAAIGQAHSVATMLRDSAEAMLASDQLSPLRRLVTDAATAHRLSDCRISLPDGKVLADADPTRINAERLPTAAPTAAAARALRGGQTAGARSVEVNFPLEIAGKPVAELRVTAPLDLPGWLSWEAEAGLGVIGVGALVGLLLVYRMGRARLRAMGAIREALLAIEQGETRPEVLAVADDLGAEAAAWNDILAQTQKLRQAALADAARQSLGERRKTGTGLDEAFDVLSQGLLLLDDHLKIRSANGAAGAFLQTDRQLLVGADAKDVFRDPQIIELMRSWTHPENRRRVTIETRRPGEDPGATGGVLRWNLRPMRKDDTAAVMIVIDDITQQRVAEEAHHQFVAQATHELRTPLTNIRLYVETALDEGDRDAALRSKCLNVINSETRRLQRIVSDMLSTAEIEAGCLRIVRDDVRLSEVFTELQADYEALAADKHVTLVFKLPPKLPTIQADRDKLMLAMHNLVSNALKYTTSGGSITVNVDVDHERLAVDVVDTGLGISDDDQQRIFEKFYRSKDQRIASITGSGLGLALAREVVRLHGGEITVLSEINKGSTFTLTLPNVSAA